MKTDKTFIFLKNSNDGKGKNATILNFNPDSIDTNKSNAIQREADMINKERQFKIENRPRQLKRWGKKGETITYQNAEYTILERTDQFIFAEVRSHLRNPDGSYSAVKPRLEDPYWNIATVRVDKEINEEIILFNFNLEFLEVDAWGFPTEKIGFNKDKERVYAIYLKSVAEYDLSVQRKARQETENENTEKEANKKASFQAECHSAKYKSVGDLRTMLSKVKDVKSLMKSEDFKKLINEISTYDALLKYL